MLFAISTLSGNEPALENVQKIKDKRYESGFRYVIDVNSIEELTGIIEVLDLPIYISRKVSDTKLHEIQILDHFD